MTKYITLQCIPILGLKAHFLLFGSAFFIQVQVKVSYRFVFTGTFKPFPYLITTAMP